MSELKYKGDTMYLGDKVDIDGNIIESVENPEFIEVTTDSEGKVINGTTVNGEGIVGGVNVNQLKKDVDAIDPEGIKEEVKEAIDEAVAGIGEIADVFDVVDDPEKRLEVVTDKDGKIISFRDICGVKHEEVGIESNRLKLSPEGLDELIQDFEEHGIDSVVSETELSEKLSEYSKTVAADNRYATKTLENTVQGQESQIDAINESLTNVSQNVDTINEALSGLVGQLPSGVVTGDNVWTGVNQFAQPITGVSGTNDNNVALYGQFKNTNHRYVDAADYGLDSSKTGIENSDALQAAIQGGNRTVTISRPGVYLLSKPILISDNTEILCGRGVIFKKNAVNQNLFRNEGAATRTVNRNITIAGLHLVVNGYGNYKEDCNSDLYGLRGELAFLCTEGLKIIDYTCEDLGTTGYGIIINQSSNFVIDTAVIKGRKDAIHISSVDNFVIKNVVCQTFDDCLALNASDWISSNCVNGDIKNGIIENVTDEYLSPTTGYLCRLLVGAWVDWFDGMEIHRGDTVVNNGRIYRAVIEETTTELFTSHTEPTITTFSGVQEDVSGFKWKLMRDDTVYYSANIFNVEFRNIKRHSIRVAFAEEVYYGNSEWDRGLYPTVNYNDYPNVNVTIKEMCSNTENVYYSMSSYCNSYVRIDGMNGSNMRLNLTSPVSNKLRKVMCAEHIDFRDSSDNTIKVGSNTELYLSRSIAKSPLRCNVQGVIVTDCNVSELPGNGVLGNSVKYNNLPMVYDGSDWKSLI